MEKPVSPRHLPASGMTLRDWFAGQVLAGFMSAKAMHFHPDHDAAYCYKVADAMLAERAKAAIAKAETQP